MKNVLVITYYWPPAGGPGVQRTLKFVKYMKHFGWNPIVLVPKDGDYPTKDNSHIDEVTNTHVVYHKFFEPHAWYKKVRGMNKDEPITSTILTDKSDSLTEKIAKWIRLNLFIPDARVGWLFSNKSTLESLFKNQKIDLIFSSGPPFTTHLLARKWGKRNNIPFVVDFRDPWTDFVSYQLNKRFFLSVRLDRYLEKKVVQESSKTIVISPSMKKSFSEMISSEHIEVITNGYDVDDFEEIVDEKPKHFCWTYAGNLDKNRVPYAFLAALKEFNQHHKNVISCQFIGRQCEELITEIKRLNIETLCVLKAFMPHKDVVAEIQSSYGLVLVIDDVPNNKSFLTGKIFEYIGAQKSILALGPTDGDASEILEESCAGKMFGYQDSESVVDFLKSEYAMFLNGSVRQVNAEKFQRDVLTHKLCKIFDRVVYDKKN